MELTESSVVSNFRLFATIGNREIGDWNTIGNRYLIIGDCRINKRKLFRVNFRKITINIISLTILILCTSTSSGYTAAFFML
jgi:hypothetical protein